MKSPSSGGVGLRSVEPRRAATRPPPSQEHTHGADRDPHTPVLPDRGGRSTEPAAAPKLRRMSFGLLLVYVAILAVNSGGNGILLPNIVAGLDEAGKIGNLAIVTTVAFIANIFAQPIAGALSDTTRSRFGRRTPWMVGGALLTSGFLVGLPMAQSVLTVALVWLVVQVGVNAVQAAATAIVPDRYPASRRGGVSAMIGVGITIGNAVGVVVAGGAASQGMLPYVVLAALVLVIIGGFVLVNREEPSTHLPRQRTGAKEFLRGFWVDPRQHPDFAWAFGSRFLMVIGFYGAQTYGLYILRDYIGLSDAESNSFAATMGVVLLVGVLLSALVSGWLSDRVGRRKPFIVWSSVVMSVALAIPLVVPTTQGVLAYAFLLGLGFGAYISIDLALMTEVLPARLQGESSAGRDLAILGLATTLPQAHEPLDRRRPGHPHRWLPRAVRRRHRVRHARRRGRAPDQGRAMTAHSPCPRRPAPRPPRCVPDIATLADRLPAGTLLTEPASMERYSHDEAEWAPWALPLAVARPTDADQVRTIVRVVRPARRCRSSRGAPAPACPAGPTPSPAASSSASSG